MSNRLAGERLVEFVLELGWKQGNGLFGFEGLCLRSLQGLGVDEGM